MKKTTKQTARETYETRQREIAAMLDLLKSELVTHDENAHGDGLHFGHVGDLEHIRQSLKETLVFLTGGRDEDAAGRKIETAIAKALA